jgi:hypothetical protein
VPGLGVRDVQRIDERRRQGCRILLFLAPHAFSKKLIEV